MAIDRRGVGKRAKKHREEHHWTLREVADWAGLNPGTLSHYEKGERVPGDENVTKLAKGLRVSEAWLLGLEE
jgi:transcriptional regulator with XRE-family HTH domain